MLSDPQGLIHDFVEVANLSGFPIIEEAVTHEVLSVSHTPRTLPKEAAELTGHHQKRNCKAVFLEKLYKLYVQKTVTLVTLKLNLHARQTECRRLIRRAVGRRNLAQGGVRQYG